MLLLIPWAGINTPLTNILSIHGQYPTNKIPATCIKGAIQLTQRHHQPKAQAMSNSPRAAACCKEGSLSRGSVKNI